MTFGKWLCKSHVGPSFLACENPLLYSVFSNNFSPKVWVLVCSVRGRECPWVLGIECTEEYVVSQSHTPGTPRWWAVLGLLPWFVSRCCWLPTDRRASRATGLEALPPTPPMLELLTGRQGWAESKTCETCQDCTIFWRQDVEQREVKVLSPLILFMCSQSSLEELSHQANVSVIISESR